jgi:DNA helicase II / ATP-dependent DNA helicase PcrA
VPADACLAITFTRRATEELRARLAALLQGKPDCAVHSFHSLGLALLRAHGAVLGLPADFRIADEAERAELLMASMAVSKTKAARLLKAVSVLKRTAAAADPETAEALAVLRGIARERGVIDFDDLVGMAVEILENDAAIATRWRERFRHICADEFQDVDEPQYRMLRALAGTDGDLCVIGDPNQAIYGFRGAHAACFDALARDFPAARTVLLSRNYRSTGAIVAAATAVIGDAEAADIVRPMQDPITFYAAPSERAEAEFVVGAVEALLGGRDMLAATRGKRDAKENETALSFADFAVLYRTDAQSVALREAFDRAGIPFKKSSPAPIAGQAAVQALLGGLERQDGGLRVADLATRLGAAADDILRCDTNADVAALSEARYWLAALARSDRVAGDVARLREQAALSTEADFWDPRADRVSLLTMHAAKGLEFPVVFVVGLEDGLVPFSFDGAEADNSASLAEERRLFYVAMTRAKDRLFLTRAGERFWRGQVRTMAPSRFLNDIPARFVTLHKPVGPRQRQPLQYSLF